MASRAWMGSMPSCCAAASTAAAWSSRRTPHSRRRRAPDGGATARGDRAFHRAQLGCSTRVASPAEEAGRGRAPSRSRPPQPVEQLQPFRHTRSSRRTPRWPAASGALARRSAAVPGDARRATLSDDLAAEGKEEDIGPVAGDNPLTEGQCDGRSIAAPKALDRNKSGNGFSEPRPV